MVGVEVASGSIAREHPRGDGIGGGLPVANGLADRNDEFVEWVFEDDGVPATATIGAMKSCWRPRRGRRTYVAATGAMV